MSRTDVNSFISEYVRGCALGTRLNARELSRSLKRQGKKGLTGALRAVLQVNPYLNQTGQNEFEVTGW